MNKFGRIIFCGSISQYNQTDALQSDIGLRLTFLHVARELKTQGFFVTSYTHKYEEATRDLVKWFREGKLKVLETKLKGFDKVPEAMQKLFTGEKLGKVIVDLMCESE